VRQDFDLMVMKPGLAPTDPDVSPILDLAEEYAALLRACAISLHEPWLADFVPTDVHVQRYVPEAVGISSHRDSRRFIKLISVFSLGNPAEFRLCRDRRGSQLRRYQLNSGDLLLLRALGFAGRPSAGPLHSVSGPAGGVRYSITFRMEQPTATAAAPQTHMAEAVRFGASISTSGRYALQGRQALAGLRAWAKATNLDGGVRMSQLGDKLPVALIHYDDASSSERAVANVEKLIQVDGVHVLIGPYASDLTRAVVAVAHQHGKLLWNHGGASDDIHRPGRGVVGILTPASLYFAGLLELVRSIDADAKKAVFLYRRGSRFGRLAARGAQAVGRRTGFVDGPGVSAATWLGMPPGKENCRKSRRRPSASRVMWGYTSVYEPSR
jgi:hypothetical protein